MHIQGQFFSKQSKEHTKEMALIFAVAVLFAVKTVHSAIDTGVTVYGTTLAPNFQRLEGRCESFALKISEEK